ncbi:MAG TPA: DUF2314 domain-containing protein [Anaerolineales bacterium]|nr:DUF2314 domain-containing protein [Anaerolineales bacterium]
MVKPLQLKILVAVCLLFTASCGQSATPTPTTTFRDPDQELVAAVAQAQSTLSVLRGALLAPKPSYVFLGLKVRFTSSDGRTEDMWTEASYILDNVYIVQMIEGVTLQRGAHPDRFVEIKPDQIIDWMIKEEDGTVHGGYTLRLDFGRMTPEQQQKYLEVTGYKFD